jgi:CPA1 family monovalent cation:H+ antiporter
MQGITQIEEYAVLLLLVATLVGITARRLRMPYTVGLVIVGTALTLVGRVHVDVAPELIFGILVPPLIFEAAFHIPIQDLRRNLYPILLLAIVGVLMTTFLVGGIVSLGTGIALKFALLFGAIIAATDPVSVIALFRSLGISKRLQILLEGESLLNDGTAIVVFQIALTAAAVGTFDLASGIVDFLRIATMGLLVGLVLGWLASIVIARVDDHLIETAITFVLAYASYLVAEEYFHVSGVLAVVAAGLANGNIGPRGMSPTTRLVVFNFWEFMSFLANSFVFLLIGLVIDVPSFTGNLKPMLWGILAALLARAIVIYGLFPRTGTIPAKWKHILYWGGLRGAISLALAISLPASLGAERGQLQAMVFGVVFFTLLVQGTSMSTLVRRTGIVMKSEEQEAYNLQRAQAVAAKAGYDRLKKIHEQGMMSTHTWQVTSQVLDPYLDGLTETVREVFKSHPEVEAEERDTAWREFLRAQRTVLIDLYSDHTISEEIYSELTSRVDGLLTSPSINWTDVADINRALWPIEEDGGIRTQDKSDDEDPSGKDFVR